MKTAYAAITAQMEADVRDALDFAPGDSVQIGNRVTPHNKYPNATIWLSAPIQRSRKGARIIQEDFTFGILVQLKRNAGEEAIAEALKVEAAEKVIQKLAPFTEDAPDPAPGTIYAGEAMMRSVDSFDPLHNLDSDAAWSFMLTFTCSSGVYQ